MREKDGVKMDDYRKFNFFGLIARIAAFCFALFLIYQFIIRPLFG